MKCVRSIGAAAAAGMMAWAAVTGAQVMDQVPGNAAAVLEIRNVDGLNTKISKTAEMFGLTQTAPELKDPLANFEDQIGISDKGLNKSSDMAVAYFAPGTPGVTEQQTPVLLLLPVSDYKQFLDNFTNTKDDGGGITEGTGKPGDTVYIAHWGNYAAYTLVKDFISKPPTGIKLTGVAADELKKDAILYVNADQLRTTLLPQLKDHREDTLKQWMQTQDADDLPDDHLKGLLKAFDSAALDEEQELLGDAKFGVVSANLTDDGIAAAAAAEFMPDSKFGKLAALSKGTDQPMLAGLPDRKYFALMGMLASPEFKQQFVAAILDPIVKAFDTPDGDKSVITLVKTIRDQLPNVDSLASGFAVPDQIGKGGMLENVSVISGNVPALTKAYTGAFPSVDDFVKGMIPAAGPPVSASMVFKPDATTVDGVHFDQFTLKTGTGNGPPPVQMQMMMGAVLGPGPGGYIGHVNDKTLLLVTGVDDQSALMADAIASAKTGKDVLNDGKSLQSVAAMLPKERVAESFVYVDHVLSEGIRMGQMFGLPARVHVPADLPPVGLALSGDGNATLRLDAFLPTALAQSMVGVVNDLQNQMMHFGGGPNGPGGGL
jgi:hypothetical protein